MAGGSLQSRTVRLFLAVALNGGLFVVLRRLVFWSGPTREGLLMAAGSVLAVATLVVLGPVLRRGPAPERVAAGVLCLLPVFGLVGMLVPLLRWGR